MEGMGRQKIIQQANTYKNFFNFERDDIELIVDGENVSLTDYERIESFKKNEKSDNCYGAQNLKYELNTGFNYYFTDYSKEVKTIKIIFKKKLYNCDYLFNGCKTIIEINMEHFDCSQVISCKSMFNGCDSLKKTNLGKLDFSLCKNFENMFNGCQNLENLDLTHLNTKNSTTFEGMFCDCKKLKIIDVSKFDSSHCTTIYSMFKGCENLSEINMINWDMRGLESMKWDYDFNYKKRDIIIVQINNLFEGCKSLKIIKMSCSFGIDKYNVKIFKENQEVFEGLPSGGTFYWKKGENCDWLLKQLPVNWNRVME